MGPGADGGLTVFTYDWGDGVRFEADEDFRRVTVHGGGGSAVVPPASLADLLEVLARAARATDSPYLAGRRYLNLVRTSRSLPDVPWDEI